MNISWICTRSCQTFSKVAEPFSLPPSIDESCSGFTSSSTLVVSPLNFSHTGRYILVGLICISVMRNDDECLFICLLATYTILDWPFDRRYNFRFKITFRILKELLCYHQQDDCGQFYSCFYVSPLLLSLWKFLKFAVCCWNPVVLSRWSVCVVFFFIKIAWFSVSPFSGKTPVFLQPRRNFTFNSMTKLSFILHF